jgi:hypothetical protein
MAASSNGYNATDPTKLKPGDPGYVAPNTTVSPLPTNTQNQTNPNIQLTNDALSGKAASLAMGTPYDQGLATATTQAATDFVKNPMGDFDPNAYKQGQLEKADLDWANQFESARQMYGNASGSGLNQKEMLGNALQHNTDMQALEANIDSDSYDKRLNALSQSIGLGNTTNANNASLIGQGIQNINVAKAMNEPELDRQFQEKMTRLSQDFTAKGISLNALLSNIANLPPEQQAQIIKQTAKDAGITWTDEQGNVQSGLQETGPAKAEQAAAALESWQPGQKIEDPKTYAALTDSFDTILQEGTDKAVDFSSFWNRDTTSWNGSGWSVNPDVSALIDRNIGKIVKGPDGRLYEIVGKNEVYNRNGTSTITFKDVQTGLPVNYSKETNGKGKSQGF